LSPEEKLESEILAVSVDPKSDLQRMVDRISREDGRLPDYIFLSDPGHRVIDRYGLLNPDDPRGIPHPTTYVIDKGGIVRWKFTEVDYKIRPTNRMILEALRTIK
jgi:peroxiredoxin